MLGVLSPDDFLKSARTLDRVVREVGGKTVLLMLWGSKYDARVTVDTQADVVREIGKKLDVTVVPIGPAWRLAMQENPDLRLYESGSDAAGLHGSYLNAAVLTAALINVDPSQSAYLPHDAEGEPLMSQEDAQLLRRVAWQAVMARNAEP